MTKGLGEQIREMRVAMGHTQQSFALAIGVHFITVSKWERGETEPLPAFLQAIRTMYAASLAQGNSAA